MTALWVPPKVSRELIDERQQREAKMLQVVAQSATCKEFDPELQRIDPDLSMVFCPEPAPLDAVACGARPGRFNIMRSPQNGPRSFMPITGPAGEFIEPTSRIFEELRRLDWWDPEVRRERRALEARIDTARQRREAEELREIDEEMYERFLAATRTQVSMNRDTPWAQNAQGYKRVRGQQQ